jgi:hypothetical protein
MKFKYNKFPSIFTQPQLKKKGRLVPLIPVGVFNKSDFNKFIYIRALIDSGAGFSIFPAAIGEAIGLEIENELVVPIMGINKSTFDSYLHEVVFEVGGWKYETCTCFCHADTMFPVLGQEGFFSLFKVTLNHSKAEIELKNVVTPIKIDSH